MVERKKLPRNFNVPTTFPAKRDYVVLPARIERAFLASEASALSVELRERFMSICSPPAGDWNASAGGQVSIRLRERFDCAQETFQQRVPRSGITLRWG